MTRDKGRRPWRAEKPVLLENERDMLKDVSMHSKSDSGKSSRLPRAKNTQHKERVDVELLNKYRRIQGK
jgi:hypothetical protein